MSETIATDSPFGEPQRELLAALAALMIPAENELPSAADSAIFAAVVAGLVRQPGQVDAGLGLLTSMAKERFSAPFPSLNSADKLELVATLRSELPAFMTLFESTVAAAYYRDDRVLRSLDLPARAPFPEGHAVTPTDWSLLDPVRQRPPFYRNV